MSRELELKYGVKDLAAVEAWLDEHVFGGIQDGGWREQKVTDRYFDTADGALASAGYGARLRRQNGRTTVGLKTDEQPDRVIHRRLELEAEASPSLSTERWPPSEARRLVKRMAADRRLHERFVLHQQRRVRDLGLGGSSCQFFLDDVEVRRGRQRLGQLYQLEVELKEGDEAALHEVAALLEPCDLLRPERRSKMVMAAELVAAARPVRAEDPFAEAGRRVLGGHLQRMLEREQVARLGDRLALKQMRVATRRMRATWRLFDGAYRSADARRYVAELRRVARRLGSVRDLDVLLERLPQDTDVQPLAEAWAARRDADWRKLLRLLDSQAYRRFVADYVDFSSTPAAANGDLAELRVRDVAGGRLWAAYEAVRAYEPRLTQAQLSTLHALRIAAKRLRYALETFGPALPRHATRDLLPRLTLLQDHLGTLNDADIAARAADEWLSGQGRDAPAATRRAVKAYIRAQRAEVDMLRGSFPQAWRGVGGATFGRTLAGALAAL